MFPAREIVTALILTLFGASLTAQTTLTPGEQRIRDAIAAARDDQVAYLQRVVDIPSSTLNLDGVRRVGGVFRASLDSLGFTTRWVPMPDAMRRAGHLVAEHRGRPGAVRVLLIGHFDTVVEPGGPNFVREDSMAHAVGGGDMKGGDVIILYALKALQTAGVLRDLNITVVSTGDEEHPGEPLDVARAALIEAGHKNDVALAFEGGSRSIATVARRGSSAWRITAAGRQAHSAGVFGRGAGYGAIYELARILDAFRVQLVGEQYLTFNAASIVGGTDVAYDTVEISGTTSTKLNIVPRTAIAAGDLRFMTPEQLTRTRERMRAIVAQHLPGTDAQIAFLDEYPAMPLTPGNSRLLAVYDSASQALGYGPVAPMDPGSRGAGDLSFVAPFMDGLEGLGALGTGAHSPGERVNLNALPMQTERAALMLARLGAHQASEFTRPAPAGGN
jgi:glutamate carboxypeptidase